MIKQTRKLAFYQIQMRCFTVNTNDIRVREIVFLFHKSLYNRKIKTVLPQFAAFGLDPGRFGLDPGRFGLEPEPMGLGLGTRLLACLEKMLTVSRCVATALLKVRAKSAGKAIIMIFRSDLFI